MVRARGGVRGRGMVYEAWPWHVARRVHREMRVVRDDERDPEEPKKNQILRYGEKGCAAYGRNGVVWVEKWYTPWRAAWALASSLHTHTRAHKKAHGSEECQV